MRERTEDCCGFDFSAIFGLVKTFGISELRVRQISIFSTRKSLRTPLLAKRSNLPLMLMKDYFI